jgi:fucose permease
MLILAAVLAIFVYGLIAAMLGTILPDLSKRFNLTPKQNGNIAMAQAIGLMIGSFAAGPLMDVYGKKLGVVGGLLLIAVALVGLRGASGYSSIVALMLLLGTGGGALVNGGNALPPEIQVGGLSTAGVFNILNLFFGLGGLVTPLIAARLFQNNTSSLLMFAVVATLIAMGTGAIAPMAPASGQVSFQASAVAGLIGRPALILLSLLLFLYVACEVGVWNWLARHLIAQGVPESRALTILSLGFALGLLIGRVAVSPVLSSVSPEIVLIASGALMAVTTFLMLQSSNPTTAWVLVFLAGIAMAPVFPTALAVVNQTFAGPLAATATGITLTAGWLGLVVSSPIIGAIAGDDPRRLRTALLVLPAFSVAMVVVLLALRAIG